MPDQLSLRAHVEISDHWMTINNICLLTTENYSHSIVKIPSYTNSPEKFKNQCLSKVYSNPEILYSLVAYENYMTIQEMKNLLMEWFDNNVIINSIDPTRAEVEFKIKSNSKILLDKIN